MAKKNGAKASANLSKAAKAVSVENKVAAIYRQRCNGIQVDMLDLSRISEVGIQAANQGRTDQEIGDAIAAFVETIRKN